MSFFWKEDFETDFGKCFGKIQTNIEQVRIKMSTRPQIFLFRGALSCFLWQISNEIKSNVQMNWNKIN